MKNKYSHIIWDWNGTLFDDVNWCINVINQMLDKRRMKILSDVSAYHEAFGFSIIEYYKNVGFDFSIEPFEALAAEYISLYHSDKSGNCKLHNHAEAVLKTLAEHKTTQVILSASESNNLAAQMNEFPISHYFDEVLGLTNVYAASKIDIGLDYLKRKQPERTVLIGDTAHDYEVAESLGIDCLLIPNGHQAKEKLLTCNVPVLDDISQVVSIII